MPRSTSEIAAKAIDDFWGRTFPLQYLERFPVDQIKVNSISQASGASKQ
jgi:EAL domain-containing protein (putative c-di-GMP-specific phosphodiesterase class I)